MTGSPVIRWQSQVRLLVIYVFSPSSRFVSALLEKPEVEVMGASQGPTGSIIHSLFVSAQRVRVHCVCSSFLHLQSVLSQCVDVAASGPPRLDSSNPPSSWTLFGLIIFFFFNQTLHLKFCSCWPGSDHRWCSLWSQATAVPPVEDEFGMERNVTAGNAKVPDFPSPTGREILLRTCVPRPAPYSKALPQRLFCVMLGEEFRLAGAFSSDTSFFWTPPRQSALLPLCDRHRASSWVMTLLGFWFDRAPMFWSASFLRVFAQEYCLRVVVLKEMSCLCFNSLRCHHISITLGVQR